MPQKNLKIKTKSLFYGLESRFWDMNTTGKAIYYGHTPNKNGNIVKQLNDCYAMDVGAVFFDNLKILETKSKETFEVWA